jgi:hypothetical protein
MKIDQKFIDDFLLKIQEGVEAEQDKFELKSKWYDLNTNKGCEELCKDVSAIANTTSYDEGLLIIGVDKSKAKLANSPFASSGIDDASKLRGIIVKRIDRPPEYSLEEIEVSDDKGNNKILSVFRIHPSYNKPHILKTYNDRQNYIPIRKGTSINSANRDDLEIMFYDRTKIEPGNRIEINVYRPSLVFRSLEQQSKYFITARAFLLLDNSGRRPAAIAGSKLTLSYKTDKPIKEVFEGYLWKFYNTLDQLGEHKGQFPVPIMLGSNKPILCELDYALEVQSKDKSVAENLGVQYKALNSYNFTVSVETINQNEFLSDTFYFLS